MVKFCRPKTSFLKILFSFEYLVLRCSTENYGFSFFCFWSFVIILNCVGATVLGFLFNLMKYIIHPYIAPNPSILINFFKDFILYPLTLIKKFHWLLAISHCVCLGPDSPRGSIIELPIEMSEAGEVRLNFQTCKPSCWTQGCQEGSSAASSSIWWEASFKSCSKGGQRLLRSFRAVIPQSVGSLWGLHHKYLLTVPHLLPPLSCPLTLQGSVVAGEDAQGCVQVGNVSCEPGTRCGRSLVYQLRPLPKKDQTKF